MLSVLYIDMLAAIMLELLILTFAPYMLANPSMLNFRSSMVSDC